MLLFTYCFNWKVVNIRYFHRNRTIKAATEIVRYKIRNGGIYMKDMAIQTTTSINHLFENSSTTKEQSTFKTLVIKYVKDPGSAITHFIGMVMAIGASIPLLIKASRQADPLYLISMSVYALSLILLYAASTTYHTFDRSERINTILKKIDHMMISVLIAGSYTPICLLVLNKKTGIILLSIVWGIALIGILIKAFWVYCPKWVSSILYIGMGWTCVLAFTQIFHALSPAGFGWLLIGGIIYTVGGVIYALKLPVFNNRHKYFGSHEIFHLFVMGGSLCHYIVMYAYI